jgi:hypothetical protein
MDTDDGNLPTDGERRPTPAAQLAAAQGVGPWDPAAWPGDPDLTAEELDRWLSDLRRLRSPRAVRETREDQAMVDPPRP